METIYLQIHHMSTPSGEYSQIACPHCAKEIELRASILPDGEFDRVVLDYGANKESTHSREGSDVTAKMKFLLFSKIEFEVLDPVALIESYCFQSDFYENYDLLLPNRDIKSVNKIGARIKKSLLPECKRVVEDNKKNTRIFEYDNLLDEFLALDDKTIGEHVREVSKVILSKLVTKSGIGLSKGTKILHTFYPGIIPMIDDLLQKEYRLINAEWKKEEDPGRILLDYYKNLKEDLNRQNLARVYETISRSLPKLTKVRVFDILWWSYLKAKTLKEKKGEEGININWSTIKWKAHSSRGT